MSRGPVALNHVSVVSRDLDESVAFYVELFGLEPVPAPDFGFEVRWLQIGDRQLHLFHRPEAAPVTAHFSLEVDDPVRIYRVAEEHGILDTERGVRELPGGELQLYLRDPSGNLVEVNHRDAAAFRDELPLIRLADLRPQDGEHGRASLFMGREPA